MLGGFGRYSERLGAPGGTLTVGMPISLRSQDDPQGGNRFTGVRLSATLDEPDPAARVRNIRAFVLSARESAGSGVVNELLGPVLGWMPAPVIGAVSGALTSANDVQVSQPPRRHRAPLHRRVADHPDVPVRPAPRLRRHDHAAVHEDQCCIGLNLDAAAVTDPEGLVADLRAGLDEVVALGR